MQHSVLEDKTSKVRVMKTAILLYSNQQHHTVAWLKNTEIIRSSLRQGFNTESKCLLPVKVKYYRSSGDGGGVNLRFLLCIS